MVFSAFQFVFYYHFYIILYLLFGTSSNFYERMQKEKKSSLFYPSCAPMDYLFLTEFVAETTKPDDLKDDIIETFLKEKITEEDLERGKKVKISNSVIASDSPYKIVDKIINDLIEDDEIIYNRMDIIKSITMEDINKVRKIIADDSIDNYAFVVEYPKE